MKIGDDFKIKIDGRIISGIILGDMITTYSCPLTSNFNYLSLGEGPLGHQILNDQTPLHNYYKTLIGDQIVYVETRDILEWI